MKKSVRARSRTAEGEGWEAHRLAQLRRMARRPFGEKLTWLEDAHRLAERLQGRRAPRSGTRKTRRG